MWKKWDPVNWKMKTTTETETTDYELKKKEIDAKQGLVGLLGTEAFLSLIS